jgi:excisionase family DNA binding protein
MTEQREFLTTRQVGDLLGLSPASVLRRWRSGELPGYRLGSNVLRFRAAELEAWLEARRRPVDPPGGGYAVGKRGALSTPHSALSLPDAGKSANE